jgi:class 3 adenylate cyclase
MVALDPKLKAAMDDTSVRMKSNKEEFNKLLAKHYNELDKLTYSLDELNEIYTSCNGDASVLLNSAPKYVEGICVFFDMKDSTALKRNKGGYFWLVFFYNMIIQYKQQLKTVIYDSEDMNFLCEFFDKCLGDGFMVFIDTTDIDPNAKAQLGNLIIENSMHLLDNPHFTNEIRISFHYCFNIFRVKYSDNPIKIDYFGSDIDLAARLCSKCLPSEGIISKRLQDVIDEYFDDRLDQYNYTQCSDRAIKGFEKEIIEYFSIEKK